MKKPKKPKKIKARPSVQLPLKVRCFFVEDAGISRVYLRRYVSRSDSTCPVHGYHNAMSDELARFPHVVGAYIDEEAAPKYPESDSRWPAKCDCGYAFTEKDPFQVFTDAVYVDKSGKEYSLRKPVPGMMWNAWWYGDSFKGDDERSLVVVCPDGHEWCIDSRASNCTMPKDNEHHCWVRHGEPPVVTVDKRGNTCKAGAGSIMTPGYHGHLTNGIFNP